MATKIKGIYKGFKYISQIFVVKDREMEIGYPTDVKHVAHIGWDSAGSAPSWMNDFKPGPDFSVPSISNINQPRDSNPGSIPAWSSKDLNEPMGHRPATEMFKDSPTEPPKAPRKQKRRKKKSTSSPTSSSSSSRSSRAAKLKAKYSGAEAVATL